MKTLNVSLSPHIRSGGSTTKIMLDVIIALLPALGVGVYVFGWRALLVTAISVASCVATEFIYEKLMKLPVTIGDLSAVVTGLILAVNLYSTAPWWIPLIGGVFAILIVKMLFGGIGQNFMNPALAARCFLLLSFSRIMTSYPVLDGMSSATPLQLAKAGETVAYADLFLGTHSGTIGETSAIAILIGALYLFIRRVISPRAPLTVIGSTVAFVALFTVIKGEPLTLNYLAVHAFGGGLLVGAVFMASDYATTPVTFWGQIIFGVVVGLLTAVIRCFGGSFEGMSFAILIANLLTPIIEKLTYPKPFGVRKERVKKAS
ncbi:MAG: RnfABCDGE type electron transport complex subunit D [Clostridia bacterium]|nr:RnfABCDGE type electron transport complex subunit D [Clostridia bacterium]